MIDPSLESAHKMGQDELERVYHPADVARFRELEGEPLVFAPGEFASFMTAEAKRWGHAVEASGVRGD